MLLARTYKLVLGAVFLSMLLFPRDVSSESVPSAGWRGHRIPFRARNGAIYIDARVNGRRASLLVDTGATATMFGLNLVPTLNSTSKISVNLAKGSVSAYRFPVGFSLVEDSANGGRSCSFHREVVVGDFKFPEADGVIGLDVLSAFKSATVDFLNSVLVLEDR